MSTVTIPKEMGYDPHYRYKRPKLECNHTCKSKRTVITNITELCLALEITPPHLRKLLQAALPATALTKAFVLKGIISANTLDDILEGIIVGTLLCKDCRNPEVAVSLKSGKARCKACGARCRDRDYKK